MNEDAVIRPSAAVEGASEPPRMSTPATLVGVFSRPKTTFQALAARPRVLVPILALAVFHLAFGLILAQSGVLRNDTEARLEARGAPPEQIEAVTRMMDGPMRYFSVAGGPIVLVFSLLVVAGLLYFMANLMLGARLRYVHYLCVAAYGGVVAIVDQLVRLGLALGRGTLQVHLGIGAFLGEDLSAPIRALDAATDPLLLWATAVQALGVAVMARKNFGFGVMAVAPGFVILVLLSALQH